MVTESAMVLERRDADMRGRDESWLDERADAIASAVTPLWKCGRYLDDGSGRAALPLNHERL